MSHILAFSAKSNTEKLLGLLMLRGCIASSELRCEERLTRRGDALGRGVNYTRLCVKARRYACSKVPSMLVDAMAARECMATSWVVDVLSFFIDDVMETLDADAIPRLDVMLMVYCTSDRLKSPGRGVPKRG
ncbi:hypothetical protein Tco_1346162 [Tanacetum coccineum]